MLKRILVVAIIFFISSCATNSTIFVAQLKQDELQALILNSPVVKRISKDEFAVIKDPDDIEIYYKLFHFLNSPDLIRDWKKYYVLGDSSSPSRSYLRIAEIEIYLHNMDDYRGIEFLKREASKLGGTGLVDVYKKPLTLVGNSSSDYGNSVRYSIDGYLYYGLVIVEQ